MKLLSRLSLAALLAVAASSTASAAIVYSGLQNIAISSTFTSVYVDVDGMTSGSSQTTGWDLDLFFGGEGVGNGANFQPVRQTIALDAPILRLDAGTLVDGSLTYATQEAGSTTHIGNATQQFASGTEGYLGFRLIDNLGGGPSYGWMRVNFSNSGAGGTILDWAYDNSGAPLAVGVVPEPASLALLGLGGLLLAHRRRRC